MKWTEPNPPTDGESYYDYVKCETPLGLVKIEWKSWKERPSYDVSLVDTWIGQEYSLKEAKKLVLDYLTVVSITLNTFLKDKS
jgi:hypothetical protein